MKIPFIYSVREVNRRLGIRVITKSNYLTCQISTAALNVSSILVCSRRKTCELTRQLMRLVEEVSSLVEQSENLGGKCLPKFSLR